VILVVITLPLVALLFAVRTRRFQELPSADAKIESARSGRLSMRASACYKPNTSYWQPQRPACTEVPFVSSPPMLAA
jgi:hypothetical protein